MGGPALQETTAGHGVQILTVRWQFARQGDRARESRCRGQAAELGDPEVRARATDQEREEGHGVRYVWKKTSSAGLLQLSRTSSLGGIEPR